MMIMKLIITNHHHYLQQTTNDATQITIFLHNDHQ